MRYWGLILVGIALASSARGETREPPLAIVGATLHEPGAAAVENATVLIIDGRIAASGADVTIPESADRLDADGLHAYPGFIDAHSLLGIADEPRSHDERALDEDENPDTSEGPLAATRRANRRGIQPQWRAEEHYAPKNDDLTGHREYGFTSVLAAPRGGLLGGESALINLTDLPRRRATVTANVAQHASFSPDEPGVYPRTPLGAIASFRQFLYDVRWYIDMAAMPRNPGDAAPHIPFDPAYVAMTAVASGDQVLIFQAEREQEIYWAMNLADEFNLHIWISGGKEAWKVADVLHDRQIPVIADLNFDEKPDEPSFTLGELYAYYEPPRLRAERKRLWQEQVDNVQALTAAGVEVALSTRGVDELKTWRKHLRQAIDGGLDPDVALTCLTRTPARLFGLEGEIGTLTPGAQANLTLITKPYEDKKAKTRYVFVEGRRFEFKEDDDKKKKHDDKDDADVASNGMEDASTNGEDVEEESADTSGVKPVDLDWRIEIEADRVPSVHTSGNVFIRGATVLPVSGPPLTDTSILVQDGRIAGIGPDLPMPDGVTVINADGLFVMPGIVDCHSHMAIDAVNEGTLSVTAEVRVGDVIDHRQVAIYRALAGGVTTIHTMHGSANTIGGECVILKLRYGKGPDEMRFQGAHRTLKFALGENVTDMNDSPRGDRFPHTRMGVESVLRQALTAAKEYHDKRAAWHEGEPPIRRDLRLDTLADVIAGNVWVECHGYRADEYLRLIDVAESFGFRIDVLHHCLEGYRIMPEIARHGCGVSTFSNDWAYKIEAYSGIPYNAAMLSDYGICASVNSDSAVTIRYMQAEAAKSIRWGGLSTNDALALVTLNPARQLGIADRVGSIDIGKDADLAIFDGHPLDSFSRCVYTLIDGEVYFAHPEPQRVPPLVPVKRAPQSIEPIAHNDGGVYLLTNATVHPISSELIENGAVLIRDGRIAEVGAEVAVPDGATVVDLKGAHVWPGLIDAGCELGLTEILEAPQTRDDRELGTLTAELRAMSAIHPHSAHVAIARAAGITTALVQPSGGLISGTSAIIDLAGWTTPDMLRTPDFAMHMRVPSLPLHLHGKRKKEREKQHKEQLDKLENFLRLTSAYTRWRQADDASIPPRDLRLEAMAPYAAGEKPIVFRANSQKEILDTLAFAEKYGLKAIIYGGREAWKCADLLAKRHIPVILATVMSYPSGKFEAFDSVYACASVLDRAGAAYCFASDSAASMFDLPFQVALAVAHGLPPERAMRALTLGAAEILGVDDQIGSLAPGKVANLIVTSDIPIQATAGVMQVFIRGEPVDIQNMQSRERDRFAARPMPDLPPQRELVGPPSLTGKREVQP